MRGFVLSAYARKTKRESKRIAELREQGHAFAVIAARMGISEDHARVHYQRVNGSPARRRKRDGSPVEAAQSVSAQAGELAVPKRNGEPLPPQHPETWGAVMVTFCKEWRRQYLDA